MDIGLMIEGQNGLTWDRWSHILGVAERLGFPSVFRSDHYFIGKQQDSLDAYLSFVIAARETTKIRFGPLVSPVTFRSPVDVGRMAAQIHQLSGGRFLLGVGAGWNEPEHIAYGIPFPAVKERFDRLDEAIQVMRGLWAPGEATFDGHHYQLAGADCRPKPEGGRVPMVIGGGGERRTLRLVAQYADEWNSVNLAPAAYQHKVEVLERHCEAVGRDPATIRRSMMMFAIAGASQAGLDTATRVVAGMFGIAGDSLEGARKVMRERGFVVGTTDEVVERLDALAGLGLNEVELQHFDFDSDEWPEYLAADVAPKLRALS